MNIIRKWRERRQNKQKKRELTRIASVFSSIKQLVEKHLVQWDATKKRLYIAQPMAVIMLAKGHEAWCNFLQNLYIYRVYCQQQEAWENYVTQRQQEAVRKRMSTGIAMHPGEVDRIRRAVRERIKPDAVPVPPVEAFDFVIITDHPQGDKQAIVTFVGEYNPDTGHIDMAAWDDVKMALNTIPESDDK